MSDKNEKTAPPSFEVIGGWKDLAAYMGKGVRTVQRYERTLGLPVRRPAGKIAGSVIATKAEVDAWIAASPFREAFRLAHVDRGVERDFRLALNELKALIAQTHRLRSEAVQLRKSLQSSFEILQSNLEIAMTRTDRSPGDGDACNSMLSGPERRLLANVLPFDLAKRKVG
jgi:hypothetical protein